MKLILHYLKRIPLSENGVAVLFVSSPATIHQRAPCSRLLGSKCCLLLYLSTGAAHHGQSAFSFRQHKRTGSQSFSARVLTVTGNSKPSPAPCLLGASSSTHLFPSLWRISVKYQDSVNLWISSP
ncbi:hypothetical protein AMECASPLE_034182 [Ameca splendens]|uniref:Uncharacterized protein n=1 Tax=Ameca splendens TaxID=208324 RepID=A0ABV0Y769_9TELE